MTEKTKKYSTPHLDRFGPLAELTAAGTGPAAEGDMSGAGDGTGGMGTSMRP